MSDYVWRRKLLRNAVCTVGMNAALHSERVSHILLIDTDTANEFLWGLFGCRIWTFSHFDHCTPCKTKETLKNSCFSATSKQQALGLFFKNINLLYIREEPLLIYIHVYVASTTLLFQLLLRQDDTRSQCKFSPQIVLLARVLNNEQTFAGP